MFLSQVSGPEFLCWYTAFFALSCLVAFVLRACILQVSSDVIPDGEIDQYDIAYLSGGREQVYLTAIGTLSKAGVVTLDAATGQLKIKNQDCNSNLHAVEVNLCSSITWGADGKVETTYRRFKMAVESIEQRLQQLNLVPSDGRTAAAQLIPTLALLIVPVFIGLPRLSSGLVQSHPTSFLTLLLIISGLVAAATAFNKPHRTSLGAEAVRNLQGQHETLKLNFQCCPASLSSNDTTLAYALFGGFLVASSDPFNMAKTAMHSTSGSGGSGCGGGGCGGGCGG